MERKKKEITPAVKTLFFPKHFQHYTSLVYFSLTKSFCAKVIVGFFNKSKKKPAQNH